ncbi:MAG: hypothetical protein V1686_02260 [Patescibacteria group bacterium]
MQTKQKEIVLASVLVLFSFLCWWMLRMIFYGHNYFVSHWALIVGIFVLFGIANCLTMLLVKDKRILFGGFVISLLLFFIFFNAEPLYYLIVLGLLFLAFMSASKKIKKEEDVQIDLNFFRIFKRGLPIFLTALILVVSIVYYFSPELTRKSTTKINVPEKTINAILKPLEGLIEKKLPLGIDLDSNADKILQESQKQELENKFGIKVEKDDTGRKVLYKIIDYQLNNVTGAYQYLIPLGLAVGLFITLKIVSMLYVGIVIMLSWGMVKLLTKFKFIKFEKIQKEVEMISL